MSPGESPPPAPTNIFGRDELIEKVVELAENLEPSALTGAGGIGKSSIALTVIHHDRIKQRFGENRRFIRCDQFPASCAHFLARLSEVIGAGVENPENLNPLRPFLSSEEMIIVLDSAESIISHKGTGAEIYPVVEELSQFATICLLITSRTTTVPQHCRRPEIPTLSMEAASNIFYGIYCNHGRSGITDGILHHLDFHPLFITLLATTASRNSWDTDQLAAEWDDRWWRMLRTGHYQNLAVEISLTSPTFRNLGPGARDLLGVVAFFPQGVDEDNIDWLFPTTPDRKNIFDRFCTLSLAYRNNGFVKVLKPIRDYICSQYPLSLCPQDPLSSPLLGAVRDRYFRRLLVDVRPNTSGFEKARWIGSEDMNVEHLLDVSTSVEPERDDIWDACHHFITHLYWHKPRRTILGPKIEALPDDHRYKWECLSELASLFERVGDYVEQQRVLARRLTLERRHRNGPRVAYTLQQLYGVNRRLGLRGKAIRQAKEASEIFEWTNDTKCQTRCLADLAQLLLDDKQLDAAENAASRAINLVSDNGQEHIFCQLHRLLANIYQSKGEERKAIHHFETILGIASPFNHNILFWTHCPLAFQLFHDQGKLSEGNPRIGQVSSHTVDYACKLVRAGQTQAKGWGSFSQPASGAPTSPQPPKGLNKVLTTLDALIQALCLLKDTCAIPPAQTAFGSASVFLMKIRVNSSSLCKE